MTDEEDDDEEEDDDDERACKFPPHCLVAEVFHAVLFFFFLKACTSKMT